MGAWGVEMLENDTALDFIAFYEKETDIKTTNISTIIKHALSYDNKDKYEATLGMCEYLLNSGYSLAEYADMVLPKLNQAKLEIFSWKSYRNRLKALEDFEYRLYGGRLTEDQILINDQNIFKLNRG